MNQMTTINKTQYPLPLYRSLADIDSTSNLKTAVICPNTGTLDHARPLHTRSIKQVSSTFKPGLKAAILGFIALVGTAGIYCARKVFSGSSPTYTDALSTVEHTGLDTAHRRVSERAIPTALPLEEQVAVPGALFQVSHEFFTEADGGFIQQKMTHSPSWLTCQLNPIVSNYDTRSALGIQIVGTIAYIAEGSSGLTIINITTPSSPTLIGTYNTPEYAQGVQVIGNTAYVTDTSGLQIINISTPSSPNLIGNYTTPGSGVGVQVVGKTAYVADGIGGLQIINIVTPSSPTLIGNYTAPGAVYGVQVIGNTAYVADYTSGLQIINIVMPSRPTLIGTYNIGSARGVQVVGTTAYLAAAYSGLTIINITTPSKPTLIGTCDTPGNAQGVQVVGNIAYVAGGTSGLHIINITKPSSPNLITTYDTPGEAYGIQVVGNTAYVADGDSGLQILSELNRLKLSGTPSALDRSNYMVTLEGTTTAGTASTSFALNVGGELPPVYQNPISTQNAMVDENFNCIMPDNVFVDPNGDAMTYKAQDLPQWLSFDAGSRTFSGNPTPGDTDTYAGRSTIVTVVASDGKLETKGQFTVTVTGESYLAKVIKIVGPTFTALGMLYSAYKNRALFLNQIAKRKWKNNQMCVKLGENFMYALKTNVKDVRKVQAYVRDRGGFGKISEKILCGKERHVELALGLPVWMKYNTEINALYSIKKLKAIDFKGHQNMQIRVLGGGRVIKELLKLEFEGDALTLDATFDSLARQERIGLLLFPTNPTANFIEMDGIALSNNAMNQMQV